MNLEVAKSFNPVTGHREIIASSKTLIRELPTGYKYYVISHFFLDTETNEIEQEHDVCINWAKTYRLLYSGMAKECIDYINNLPA